MILPHDQTLLIVLVFLCMLCWGTWPALFKLTKKYRFELFYFDFALGLGIIALILALTFGSLGFDGFGFRDDFMNARKQEWVFAFLAAMIFNFGNMAMMAAISVAGMALAVPLSFGVALVVSSWISYLSTPETSVLLLLAGTVLIVLSLVLNSSAYSHLKILQHEQQARAGKAKSTRRPSPLKGIILATVGGLVMGTFSPLLLRAEDPDNGVGPYSLLFLFAGGVFISTFIFNLFFMNLPVEGDPLELTDFIKTPVKNHLMGLFAGIIWGVGAIASFVCTTPKAVDHPPGPLSNMLVHLAPVLTALLGLLIWKEFKGGDARVKAFSAMMLVLFVGGVVVFSYAPLWSPVH